MKTTKMLTILVLALGLIVWSAKVSQAAPMGTAFTYQGRLIDANNAADGLYDFQFKLYDANSDGHQIGGDVNNPDVDVIDGSFVVELDFGNVFDGNERWLLIGVRPGVLEDPNVYTLLTPRQKVTPTPYAFYAKTAGISAGISVPLSLTGSVAPPAAVIDATNTGTGYGVRGKHLSSGNCGWLGSIDAGVTGYSNNGNYWGYLGNSDYGVYGVFDSSGNINYGYLGSSEYGVMGKHTSSGNYGWIGSFSAGVTGYSSSSNCGFLGLSDYGVYGFFNSSGNYGYLGSSEYGAYGKSYSNIGMCGDSFDGRGVVGISYNSTGVSGYGASSTSVGVYGTSSNGTGVYGKTDSLNGYAGYFAGGKNYFEGNVGIGTTSPAAKLEVAGLVKITGGSPANGKVLTSDSVGLATWQNPTGGGGIDSDWTISGNDMYSGVSGNVGIGTTAPWAKLEVRGDNSPSGCAVSGHTSKIGGIGGYFTSSSSTGYGVYGLAPSTSGTNYGGYFQSLGNTGYGVYGSASNIGGYFTSSSSTGYGGYFITNGTNGIGIYAQGGPSGYSADLRGKVRIRSLGTGNTVMELGEGLDYAEGFNVSSEEKVGPGTVLVIDNENPGKLTVSRKAYDTKVAGIAAGAKGLTSGVRLGVEGFDCDVALAGRVYCNVDAAEYGIEPGDMLTTSDKPGYAMKATDYARASGAILGKAMEKLEKGNKGQILVLVTLQ